MPLWLPKAIHSCDRLTSDDSMRPRNLAPEPHIMAPFLTPLPSHGPYRCRRAPAGLSHRLRLAGGTGRGPGLAVRSAGHVDCTGGHAGHAHAPPARWRHRAHRGICGGCACQQVPLLLLLGLGASGCGGLGLWAAKAGAWAVGGLPGAPKHRSCAAPASTPALLLPLQLKPGPGEGFRFVGTVMFASLLMLAVALVVNNLGRRRRYPACWW